MASFVRHGHAYDLYTYEPMDLPDGVRRRDAAEILPRERVFFYPNGPEQGSVAAFANLFRYKLLLSRGGWWVDTDVVCLSETVPEADLFLGWEDADLVGSAILKIPAGHPLARGLYEESERAGTDVAWAQTGPKLLTRLVLEAGLAARPPGESGYPIPWQDALALVSPERRDEVRARAQGAPFLHLWNEIFRRMCPSGLTAPPEGSYLAELFDALPRRPMLTASAGPPDSFGVTVLLPVFFRAVDDERIRLLRAALESIHVQRFPAGYEVLVVDDGNPRPIAELAPRLGSETKAARFLRLPHNTGIASALNRGLAEARYPFIARLDQDDRWLETKIEKQLALFAADPDLTIAGTGMTLATPAGEPVETHVRPGSWAWALDFLAAGGSPFPHGSVLARRDVYRLLGGYPLDPACQYCEDYALWADWVRFFKPGMVEEALYRYTVSPDSVSVAHREKQILGTQLVQARLRDLVPARVPEALAELARIVGCTLFEAGALAFKMWRFGAIVRLPASTAAPLATLMPDREVRVRNGFEGAREAATVVGNPAVASSAGAQALHAVAR